ncbi:TonB-dependent receptor [Novosphingobium sp. PC22D]|uniref:TonB-dependent receptor n=1 Tax=Novosphingobium sp. PC22D TaxID=1962403 RepID=UPI000BF0EB3B|nr:TonB-dependent receptor [Novosphingobium sp. PC22D]PEQ10250.1 TonB-dependent receptor [Novosphingobium sp. PC22D]
MNIRNSRRALAVALLASAAALPGLAHAGELAGSAVDSTGTRALQAVTVRIVELDRVTHTDRDGRFVFADVPAGTYTVEARYVGAEAMTRRVTVTEAGIVEADFALEGIGGEDILVVGPAANQASALSRQRAADGVESVLTRDAIGQFPDQNVAESLRRLPGINILNDQGEGRFVSVRGLDPELNSTSLNGVRLPAPESDVRSVALDVISSDIIESIVVKKSLTPDMDADTIGASIEINTTSAFDRKKDYYAAKIEGSYNDYANVVTPKGSVDFSTKLSDNLGIAGGLSYYKRKFETDNVEADDWEEEDGVAYAEDLQYRDYDVERERISAAMSIDFRASDTTTLYARGNFSQFDDQEYRRRLSFDFGDSAPVGGTADTAVFEDSNGEIQVERDIKDRFERQRIRSLVLGGDTDTGTWKFNWSASWAKSSEKENGSVDPAKFERKFEDEGFGVTLDYSDRRLPLFNVTSNNGLFIDPGQYELDDIEYTALSSSQDEEYALKGDIAREFAMAGGTFTVQAGAKARWRDKTYDKTVEFYENDDLTLADVLGQQTYRFTVLEPVPSYTGATDYFHDNFDAFEFQEIDSIFDSAVEDYAVSEDIVAAYLLGKWETSTLRVIGGVRYERTKNVIDGNTVTLAEEGAVVDGVELEDDTVFIEPVRFRRKYEDWLPSLTLRFEPKQDLVLRLAGYKSLVRPKLSALAPRFAVEQNDDNEREGEFGNPDLKPYKAWNIDADVAYYFSGNGAVSLGGFYKTIDNFIVEAEYEADDAPYNGVYRGIAFDEAVIPINGRKAEVAGIEASFSQAFTMLPAPFDGLLTQLNYTYTWSEGELFDGRKIRLPSNSKNTFNAVLGYDKGPFTLRVAGTYRDAYLDEIGGDPGEDRIVNDHFQVDISAKYRLTDQIRLFADWINVNNAKYFAYQNNGGGQQLLQYEKYGPTFKFGARMTF